MKSATRDTPQPRTLPSGRPYPSEQALALFAQHYVAGLAAAWRLLTPAERAALARRAAGR